MPQLTNWFPADVLPIRPGVYEMRISEDGGYFRYCDGKNWYVGGTSPELALESFQLQGHVISSKVMPFDWRGQFRPEDDDGCPND